MVDELSATEGLGFRVETWMECMGGMHGRGWNVPTFQSAFLTFKIFFDQFVPFRVIAVFSRAHSLLNIHGQLLFTLGLQCADKIGLKGTKQIRLNCFGLTTG